MALNRHLAADADPVAVVFHYHVHVIPRYPDDGLALPAHPQAADEDILTGLAEELRA